MMNKPVAIVLGGTNPHKALIENLKDRGYYTILIDYFENPPAKEVADKHIKESTLDQEIVLGIAKEEKASLVISTCIDQANVTACYVGEKLGLPIPYSYDIAKEISDKGIMKQVMKENNIPSSNYISLREDQVYSVEHLKYPLVVKPTDSNGSKGVRRVENKTELDNYLNKAFAISRNKKAIIEEFIEGDEIGVDCFIDDSKAHIITMHKKRKPKINNDSVIFSIGSISPPNISNEVLNKIQEIANQIAEIFILKNTPLLIQLIVNKYDIKVVEFAPRIGGGLNFYKIKLFSGFDMLDAAIDSFLNVSVVPQYSKPNCFYSENHIYTESGIFGKIVGFRELIEDKTIIAFYPNKTKGMQILPGKASKDRAASFIVKANTVDEIKEKINIALSRIKVFDINGNELSFIDNYKDLLL